MNDSVKKRNTVGITNVEENVTSSESLKSSGKQSFLEGEAGVLYAGEASLDLDETEPFKCISVGDSLPYGPRMYYENVENVVRIKDIAEQHRILLVGVIGSFTPDCWNRHLFRVLKKLRYYEERGIDYICCVSTNDPFTQRAWADYLGCEESVLMWSDTTARFTKALGMDLVIPWLDNRIRSRRYVIYAENMIVTKMLVSPCDSKKMKWHCEHIAEENSENDDSDDSWV